MGVSVNTFDAAWARAATATLGDSRPAQIYSSQTMLAGSIIPGSFGGYNAWTWGNARSGHRLKFVYNGGVSGDRGDQMIARLPALIAAKPGHTIIKIGVNGIATAGAGYPTVVTANWPSGWPALPNQGVAVTTANVAAVEFSFIQYAVQRILRMGGQLVTIELERGAENLSTAQIVAAIELNRLIRDFAEGDPRINVIDDWAATHDPASSTTTTIRMKAGYMQESSGLGVHEGNLGGYKLGIGRDAYIRANWPAAPAFLPSDVSEIPANTLRWLLANPLMMTAGGTNGAGSSGTPPGSWTSVRSGGSGTQTVVVSTQATSNGAPGNECVMVATFAAAGDIVRLQQDATIGNVSVGDIIEGVGAALVDAGVALAGVYMEMQYNDGSSTFVFRDLIPLNNVAIGTEGYYVTFRTPAYQIQTKNAGAFLTMRLIILASGANSPTVRFQQCSIAKRSSF